MCLISKPYLVTFALWLTAATALSNVPGGSNIVSRPLVNGKHTSASLIDDKLRESATLYLRTDKISVRLSLGWPIGVFKSQLFNGLRNKVANVNINKSKSNRRNVAQAVIAAPHITYATPNTYQINVAIPALQPVNTGGDVPATIFSDTKVIAGTGEFGTVNGDMATAQFKLPYGISVDADGNTYIAESGGGIRMISAAGQVSSVGTDALPGPPFNVPKLNNPRGVVKDKSGNLFVANYSNHNILKITPAGVVTVFAGNSKAGTADGPGDKANIINPSGIAIDKNDILYVTDGNNAIRQITPTGYVYTLAGQRNPGTVDGQGPGAKFNKPAGIAVDNNGNVYVADRGGYVIRKITPNGFVTTIAGSGAYGVADGKGVSASFQAPVGITVDASGNLYVTEDVAGLVRRIAPDGEVKTIAGGGPVGVENGVGNEVHFSAPSGIAIGPDGNLYIAEYGKNTIKRVFATGYTIDKTLPPGLQFDRLTGKISGTPTALVPLTEYTVTAYNGGGSSKFTFAIQVSDAASSEISVGNVSGAIDACVGSPSANTQQFTVSGSNLTDNITVSAPVGFEISTNPPGGYSNKFFMVAQGNTVSARVVYVRATAAATPGNISGKVTLTSAGATTKQADVWGTVYAIPKADPIADRAYINNELTAPVNFTGTGNTFNWTNDNPTIGLAASGEDNLPSFTAVNPGSSPVVAKITVNTKAANLAYIPNYSSNSVSVINTITRKTVNTIPVGPNPGLVAVSPDGKKVYVGDVGGTSLSVIDTKTSQVKSVTIFDNPTGLVFSKDGTRVYVAGASGKCTVVDASTDAVLTSLTFFPGSGGIALSNDGQKIYVTNEAARDVRVYDTGTGVEIMTIPAPGSRYAVTSPDGTKVYVAGGAENVIWVIDVATNSMLAPISLNSDANIVALNPDGTRIYVTSVSAGTLTVINSISDEIIGSFLVGQSPEGLAVTPDGKYVYVVNVDSGTISIIDTSNNITVATIPCGLYPRAVGLFITPGANLCPGEATTFKITINPSPTAITPGKAAGLITTCIGAPSANFQQFSVSGNNLSGNISATAPAGFEISFSQTNGFTNVLSISPSGGAVSGKVIYVRAKASGTAAQLLGDVVLTTAGAASKNVTVKGVVNDLPKADANSNLVYNNGDVAPVNKFNGTGNTYSWTNDSPSIGLAASGTGEIPSFTALNTGTQPVTATITVTPSSEGYLYLAGANNVILVNTDKGKQAAIINTGGQPVGTAVSPDGSMLALTDANTNTVKFINTTTQKVVSTVNNISLPIGVCFSPDGKKVYVANQNTANITIIDVLTAKAERTVRVGFYPYGIAASADGLTVYVGCTGENAIIAVNTQTYQTTPIPVVFGPTGVAVSPDNSRVYATSAQYNGLLKIIDVATKKVTDNIQIGDVSTGICVSADGKRVYIANTQSNNVMVIDAELKKVIATIPTSNHPFGLSITPDGKYVYVANDGTSTVNVISTATNAIVNNITVNGQLGKSFGSFFVPGTGCTGVAGKFTITVNASSAITASAVTGTITACEGSPSSVTQQFKISGTNLTNSVTVTAPANFQVSLSKDGGFTDVVFVTPTGGKITDQTIFVRSSAGVAAGSISGIVTLSSPGTPNHVVNVSGIVNALPIADQAPALAFDNGTATTAVHFTGTATAFTWTNDEPSIGLPASGSGDIPSFTAANNRQTPITATITVTPSDASCSGDVMRFAITVFPADLTATPTSGSITACQGTPSATPNIQKFYVAGNGLTSNVQIAAPANFEISLSPNAGYTNKLAISPIGGNLYNIIVYVRSSADAPAGSISGVITLSSNGVPNQTVNVSGVINALPTVNALSPLTFSNGSATTAVHFTGTATTYTWVNDNPSIGLAAGGTGDITSFTAVNNGATPVTATIKVTPANASCDGAPITFKITVTPSILTAGSVSGNITACAGSASASPNLQQFTVTGSGLANEVQIKAPANFQVSFNPNTGYSGTLTIAPAAGDVNSTIVYVRSSAAAPAGAVTGSVTISSVGVSNKTVNVSGMVNALPTVNNVADIAFNNNSATTPIRFTGTATTYTWTNDNPTIGLSGGGSGDITSFKAINNGATPVIATITVTPSTNALCDGAPVTFKITVNPAILTTSTASGSITACQGSASASPNLQQFTVTGSGLGNNVQIVAPTNFQVSFNPNTGFNGMLTIAPAGGGVSNVVVYVRSSAGAPTGSISGVVTLSSTGMPNQSVNVSGLINMLPTVNSLSPLSFSNTSATTTVHFTGNATTYTWVNDNPSIGLPANGSGDIASFTAVNNGLTAITATITVVPSNATCSGSPASFTITVNPTLPPGIAVGGNLSALNTVYGTPSAAGTFSVSAENLLSGVVITPPVGFEVATDGVNFKSTLTIGGVGMLANATVYIRLAKTTFAGNYAGNVLLTTQGGASKTLAVPISTVNPALIVVTADNKIRSANSENPPLTITYSGFVNNENQSNLTKKAEAGTMATSTSPAGKYPIFFTAFAESLNYTFTHNPGVLTITPTSVVIANTFTPNGDGINDTWTIKYIEYFPKCTVDIFNRAGVKMFSSIGYGQQWDGRLSGNPVPAGTYYYVINLKDNTPVKSGWLWVAK